MNQKNTQSRGKRILLLSILVWVSPLQVFLLQAKKIAKEQIFDIVNNHWLLPNTKIDHSIVTIETKSFSGIDELHIVHTNDAQIIISSSTKVYPILGVILSLDTDYAPMLYDVFSFYEKIIHEAENNDAITDNIAWTQNIASQSSITVVPPLIQKGGHRVAWGQSFNNCEETVCEKAYNKFCPIRRGGDCGRAAVGCGGVALAQLLWYWEWPHATEQADTISEYNWAEMPYRICTTTSLQEANNIAKLLYDCAESLGTIYGANGSSSTSLSMENTLVNFGYSEAEKRLKSSYSSSTWAQMIKDEIDAGRPILYRGQETLVGSGHRFIIDGYSYNSSEQRHYYHINAGWRGDYFMLTFDELTNGGDNSFDFHYYQSAIFNAYPTPICSSYQYIPSSIRSINSATIIERSRDIHLGNIRITSGTSMSVFTGSEIRLTNGFRANSGSKVHLGIRDFPCAPEYFTEETEQSQLYRVNSAPMNNPSTDNNFEKIFRNGTILIRRGEHFYTTTGILVE